jgi:hypothetical protein
MNESELTETALNAQVETDCPKAETVPDRSPPNRFTTLIRINSMVLK